MAALSRHQNSRQAAPKPGAAPKASAFRPFPTVRCQGAPSFRTQLARDFACLLDVDDEVSAWSCLPAELARDDESHVPDFLVRRGGRHELVDTGNGPGFRWLSQEAEERGCAYVVVPSAVIREGFRLANARDLLRYARWECPLGDRIRLLAGLEENGSLTVSESLAAFRETRPIAGLAALALSRFVSIDLDSAPIGPNTSVRPWTA
ncbi:hypothetical protein EJC49_15485 [Aquibium carbonis]|jgi:hypothetical protein|uniref:Uncharacterized protein n=1 Tax=Aquibium carbonis TaxID=2495581 RepID=A0A3S0G7E1_9HYPH|nr:hypothetical protein [Aquibium carbonis]RST85489.1 hypothetical protein EJC49_15485 [Aquibium carbonis]